MDYDTYSANDAIGKVKLSILTLWKCECDITEQVYIDLNPLLLAQPGSRPIPGTDVSISSSVKVGCSGRWLTVSDSYKIHDLAL